MFESRRVHFVGIKGVGMSALAQFFHCEGALVAGSDTADEFPTDKNLLALGIIPLLFNEDNVKNDLDLVIYSRAYKQNHPEIQKAASLNISLMDYGEALACLFNRKKGIVVSGTHGKTTTTAMLGKIFEDAGLEPSVLVGGEVLDWQNNMRYGKGDFFIAEGDEYQEKFLNLKPEAVLITNIEYDHPDFFPDFKNYKNAFRKLVQKLDSNGICAVREEDKDIFGDFKGKRIVFNSAMQKDIFNKLKLKVIGRHNRLNGLAAFMLARQFGISENSIFESLTEFQGIGRRLEHYNNPEDGILLIDDYAHHPAEIKAGINALREAYPERKIAVAFQPHTFSRTEALIDGFGRAFDGAHFIAIADVYSSARENAGKITSKDLIKKLKERRLDVVYAPTLSDVRDFFERVALTREAAGNEKYIFITMGAGDIWEAANRLKDRLCQNQHA